MSRRAVVTITCDFCAHEQQPETFAVESFVIQMGSDAARAVDACEDHAAGLTALRAVVRTRGAKPGVEAATSTRSDRFELMTCQLCGKECRGGTGLSAHQRARHGVAA